METDKVTIILTKTHYEILCEFVRIWICSTKIEELNRKTKLTILWGHGMESPIIQELYSILMQNPDYQRVIKLHHENCDTCFGFGVRKGINLENIPITASEAHNGYYDLIPGMYICPECRSTPKGIIE